MFVLKKCRDDFNGNNEAYEEKFAMATFPYRMSHICHALKLGFPMGKA